MRVQSDRKNFNIALEMPFFETSLMNSIMEFPYRLAPKNHDWSMRENGPNVKAMINRSDTMSS